MYSAFMRIYLTYCRSASLFISLKAPCSLDGKATNVWDGRSRFTFPVGEFVPLLSANSRAQLPTIDRHEADHSPPSDTGIKNEWSHACTPSICFYLHTQSKY